MPASPVIGAEVCTRKRADVTPAAPRVGATKRGRTAVRWSMVLITCRTSFVVPGALRARRSGERHATPGVSDGANDLLASSSKTFPPARRRPPKGVVSPSTEDGQQVLGVLLQLGRTDAVDRLQAPAVARLDLGERLERRVGEHHEGGDALGLGLLLAPCAQRLEQLLVIGHRAVPAVTTVALA